VKQLHFVVLCAAVEPDLRATLCSTLVPTLIALIERDQTLRDSSARLAAVSLRLWCDARSRKEVC
jgi:hypothetical protein